VLATAIAAGEVSAREVTQAHLDRISAVDDRVHAFLHVAHTSALASADAVDAKRAAGEPLGPLAGVPLALKDILTMRGAPTTCGSKILEGWYPPYDSTVVNRLTEADVVILGKTNMDEFAMGSSTEHSAYGPTRNPWDLERIPGGSGGGSAAALAAFEAPLAIGTDTGGSIRIPAAFCGVVGVRPTLGRVSNRGTVPVSPNLDTVGPLARSARDVAHLLAAIEGYDAEDPTSRRGAGDDIIAQLARGTEGLRVGIPREAFFPDVNPGLQDALAAAIEVLVGEGAVVGDVIIEGAAEMPRMTQFIRNPDALVVHEERLERAPELFGDYVRERLRSGTSMTAADYARARAWQLRWVRHLENVFADVDVLLTPMVAQPAYRRDDPELHARTAALTGPANATVLAGLPSVSVPCGFVDGLPVAMQLIGPAWHDGRVIGVAHAYQQHTTWHLARPDLGPSRGAAVGA
jgi:aspartyl-tRNA(Asn)/glutamyl-tRNA(Gln) amidotransferase subunit A